jgi:hypothetical protein
MHLYVAMGRAKGQIQYVLVSREFPAGDQAAAYELIAYMYRCRLRRPCSKLVSLLNQEYTLITTYSFNCR